MNSNSKIRPLIRFFTEKHLLNKLVKLFITPIKHQITEREEVFNKSTKSTVIYIPSIKKEIVVYEYGYSKKKDLLVHGWSGRGSQFYALADKLLENGRMIITFDAPAHGNSNGKISSMYEFEEIILFLNNKYNFEAVIGHSIGAMALLKNVSNGMKVDKLISIAAVNNIDEIINNFLVFCKVETNLNPKFKTRFKRKNKSDINAYNGAECASKISVPTFIIHDSQDKPANVSSAYEIRQSLKAGTLLVTFNLGHTRILKSNLVNNRIVQFIQDE